MLFKLIDNFPAFMVAVYFVCMFAWPITDKGQFMTKSIIAATTAVLIAHLNRFFDLYPAHLNFPSGHMTLSLSVAVSLGIVRPGTLALTLPALVLLGIGLVATGFHPVIDVLGAVPLVLLIYGLIFYQEIARLFRPLDSRPPSL
jgi:membrane-associated phospholipid phosphatase